MHSAPRERPEEEPPRAKRREELRCRMTREDTELRLIEGCRVLAHHDQGDLIWGHVSSRTADAGATLAMKPAGIGLDEMEADEMIRVDLDGGKLDGRRPVHAEVFIHTEVMRARPEIRAVVHTHPIHAVAFSALDIPLLPVSHEGAMFSEGLPVYTRTSDLIVSSALGADVARTMGPANALILRNHGIVTAGRTVEEAVMTAIMLEKACRTQLLALASGEVRAWSTLEDARAKTGRIYTQASLKTAFQYCVRQMEQSRGCGCASCSGGRAAGGGAGPLFEAARS